MGKNYVIGDIQGCYRSFQELLNTIGIGAEDHMWCVGDLVNRGADSYKVLRFIVDHQNQMHTVLGNHDVHLMRRFFLKTSSKQGDTLEELLQSPDSEELIGWLAKQPWMVELRDAIIVHAGIHPFWTLEKVRNMMQRYNGLFASAEGRLQYLPKNRIPEEVSLLISMRALDHAGSPLNFKGPQDQLGEGAYPWFSHPKKIDLGKKIVFGHWSALGIYVGESVVGLDSGCVWGGKLTGICLEDGKIYSVPSRED